MTEYFLNRDSFRRKMSEIVFEDFGTPRFQIIADAVCSLYASGRTTGVVIECGHNRTAIVPVYEGSAIRNACLQLTYSGDDITEYLMKLLTDRGYDFWSQRPFLQGNKGVAERIKQEHCYVATDDFSLELDTFLHDASSNFERSYTLPDGQTITIDTERFMAPEAFFNPNMFGLSEAGWHHRLFNSIMKCDKDLRDGLFQNIVFSGGSSLFPGMAERMQNEISAMCRRDLSAKTIALPNRKYGAWIGGSILASLSAFQHTCISRDEYDEYGPDIVLRKCL